MNPLTDQYLLHPGVVFLNHGSFGATPRPVFDVYQSWQRRLENQPVAFLASDLFNYLGEARQVLGRFLGADAADLAFLPNATYGINLVARSLRLNEGDQVLSSDHEYGACENVWEFICRRRGASYIQRPVPLPLESEEAFLQAIWKGVTPRTRVIFFSHLTSPTAQLFPVREVCLRAREMGILTVVDGAHAPGHIPLNLSDLDPDYYIGNCHKWLSAPKGSAFVYTRRRLQTELDPLVVSWGWGEDPPWATGSAYLDNLQWSGTLDPSAYLSVPAAIRFQEANDWPSVQTACHALLTQSLERIEGITGLPSVYASLSRSQQMAITALPPLPDPPAFKAKLSDRYRIEVPIIQWGGGPYLRVSVGGYNSQEDIDALVTALEDLLG